MSVEVLVSLMTWGSAEDKDLSKADITEVKNLAAQLGIVLESLQVSVVQNPSQGKTENRNTEDASEHGKVGSELMLEVKKEPEVDSGTQLREMIDSFYDNSIGRNGNFDLTKNDIISSH